MKKNNKLVKVLLASSLLLPGIAPLATGVTSVAAASETVGAKQVDAQYVTVVDQVLRNVRSDQASSNGFVPAGKKVTNVRDAGKGWFEVDYGENSGYIQRSEVTSVENYEDMGSGDIHKVDSTVDSTRDDKYIVAVTTGLRTKDVDVYRPLRMLSEGEEVEYLGTTAKGWFVVKDENNVKGYVNAGDVTSVENYNDDSTPELHPVDTTNESSREGKHELLLTSSIRTKDNGAYRVIKELKRGDVVTYLGTTANDWFKVQTEDKSIGFIYRGDVTQVEEEVVEDLAVQSVSAINATQVEVTFNTEVDKASAQTGANYKIGINSPENAELQEDGKTVLLTFSSQGHVEVKDATFVVEPIKVDLDNNTEKHTQVWTYEDKVKPEVVKVESLSNGDKATKATITFSEPIASVKAIKINGKALTASTDYTLGSKATTLDLKNLDLDTSKTHTLEVLQLTDLADPANVTSHIKETFTVKVDKEAPKLVGVENVTDKGLKLVFSKPVDFAEEGKKKATDVIKVVDKAAVENKASKLFGDKTFSANDDRTEFTADFATSAADTGLEGVLDGESKVSLTVQTIKDMFVDDAGNKIGLNEKEVTLKKDEVKPEILGATIDKNKDGKVRSISFNFDKEVDEATSATVTNINDLFAANALNTETKVQKAVTDLLGSGNAATKKLSTDKKTITYTLATVQNPSGKYEFEVKKDMFEDKAATPNKNKATKVTIDFGEAATSEEYLELASGTPIEITGDNTNVITVKYAEPVKVGSGKGSAVDSSSYKLNGAALPAGTDLKIDSDQKVVTITLPAETFENTDTAAAFVVVKDVESKDGKKTLENEVLEVIKITDNVKPEATAVLNADGTITIEVSEELNTDNIAAANTANFLSGDLKLSLTGLNLGTDDIDGDHNIKVTKQTSGPLKGKYILEVRLEEDSASVDLNEVTDLKLETKATTTSADTAANTLVEEAVLLEK